MGIKTCASLRTSSLERGLMVCVCVCLWVYSWYVYALWYAYSTFIVCVCLFRTPITLSICIYVCAEGGGMFITGDATMLTLKLRPDTPQHYEDIVFRNMKKQGEKRLAIIAVSNAYGQTFIDVAQRRAAEHGIEIVNVERFNPTDASVTAQVIKTTSAKPDAVFIAAVGTP
ncbi:hypothetical protein EON63_02630, partial [archaeon]